jgi:hypothetical protein
MPLASISPLNSPRAGLLAIVIKGYCDGSGNSDERGNGYLILAGLIAPPDAWDRFEHEWRATLDDHKSPPWHSKDAYGRAGEFKEWTLERVKALRNDLYKRCFEKIAQQQRFVHSNCTVNLADYERAKIDMPIIGETSPEALCAYWFVNSATGWLPKNESDPLGKDGELLLYFDMNERFQHYAQKQWERRKRNPHDIVSRIVAITPVDHRDVLAIQAADFLAWHTNRGRMMPDTYQSANMMSWFAAPRHFVYWDYETLIRAYTL